MQLTLVEYLELKLRHHCVAIINDRDKQQIESQHPDWYTVCHIENSANVDLAGTWHDDDVAQTALASGLYRLWRKTDWDISNNRRIAAQQRIVDSQNAFAARKALAVAFFTSQGIAEAIAKNVVGSFNADTIESMAKQYEAKVATTTK